MLFKNMPALLVTVIVLVTAMIIFSLKLSKVSLEKQFEEIQSPYISSSVKVYESFNGIPHIIANSDNDLYFSIGYYHAKDRLWQMDLMRRAAEGRLSEAFGEKTLKHDLFLRSLDLKSISTNSLKLLSPKSLEILNKYSEGINGYIQNNKYHLQFEFGALNYTPEKWTPYHSVLISKFLSFEMSFSFWTDFALSEIAMKLGSKKAIQFIPNATRDTSNTDVELDIIQLPSLDSSLLSDIISNFGTGYTGSNAWAISYVDDKDSHSILANDPHLPVNLPSRWYQLHISSPSINVIGYSIPGNPNIIIGRNDSIAWGMTNVMADICDLYLVKNGRNDDYYLNENGTETEYKYMRDTIGINGKENYQYYRKSTEMSPLLSESHIWNNNNKKTSFFNKYNICFDWVNKNESDETYCLYKLNRAKNYTEFKASLKSWNTPALVFNYVDKRGIVAKLPVGNIPKRDKTLPNLLNPYWDKEFRWGGYKSLFGIGEEELREGGYVLSANNNFYPNDVFISNNWEPNSRAERIDKLLSEKNLTTIRDFEYMQMDNYSPYAYEFLYETLPIINSVKDRLNDNEKKALNKLLKWNKILSKDLNEPLIYSTFKRTLIEETIKDELGEEIYSHYTYLTNYPDRLILKLLKSNNSWMFENKSTKKNENKQLIIFRAFRKAIVKLIDSYGIDGISNLTYGEVRKLKLSHIFGDNEFIGPAVNLKPIGLGGDNTTLFNTESRYSNPNDVSVSASMRFITDMNDSLVYMILPGGSSGDPMSSNYSDQVQLWLNGGYLKLNMSRTPSQDFELKTKFIP